MKETYRNGDYTIELSPNGNQWIIAKLGCPVATIDVKWMQRRAGTIPIAPLLLLKEFLCWYYMY